MKRSLEPLRLANSPLVLVLCQVRISSVQNISKYIPEIQDHLRKNGFPVDVSGEVVEVTLQSDGPVQQRKQTHWEFRTLEEDWSIIVGKSAIVVQTTAYSDFQRFLNVLSTALNAVNAIVGSLVIERVGLRYVDAIRPQDGESWKKYVKSDYHGLENKLADAEEPVVYMQTVSKTGQNQHMIVRLAQNREGAILPSDLSLHPRLKIQAEENELVTLLDMDHYREDRKPLSVDNVIETGWDLHDGLDIVFRDTVTEFALEAWK
ncbi:MAG: TIGR04255 family protein [Gammaproteobacteria bacterium]|nr:TIGR04255 family protein [Gammaproteobacteria bacterium]MYA67521.1 TIGR04255 family protein [Gammaproteobacteria bacterium]MYC58804.1 TIGR04255 family protein [Gammaproteobacteria bacterium]MYE99739.1 TIGR04255 family protein [Gammaproteobacteria bacterium]MYG95399.1 TIGR04255 family protein [Gammaproteobacteria bacterium]